jgi:hypothetical protein
MIKLEPGDRVVSTTLFEGIVLVFTEQGRIHQVYVDARTNMLMVKQ